MLSVCLIRMVLRTVAAGAALVLWPGAALSFFDDFLGDRLQPYWQEWRHPHNPYTQWTYNVRDGWLNITSVNGAREQEPGIPLHE